MKVFFSIFRTLLILVLSLVVTEVLGQTQQTNKVDLKNTAGQTLADGTVYMVKSDMTINSGKSSLNGLKVAEGATATIFIPAGVTLTVYGKDANGTTGGGAGILVPATSTLYITGAGTLNVSGGNAADGEDGKNGGNGSATISVSGTFSASWKYSMSSGAGGAGGYGGGGAGAAIGGNGANGGAGGESPSGTSFNGNKTPDQAADGEPQSSNFTLEANRKYIGKAGEDALGMGNVYILGTVTVNATAGIVGEGGEGGTGDKYATQNATYWFTRNNVVAGGGGGGAGGGGGKTTDYAIAGGAGGASGGSAGGSGASDYAQTYTSVSNTNSYSNGGGATGYGQGGNNGKAGAGTRDAGYKTGWTGSGQFYNCQGGYGCNVSNIPGENGDNGSLTIKGSATLGGTKVRPADNTIAATNTLGVPVQLKTMITLETHGGDIPNETFEWRVGEMMPSKTMPQREGYVFVGYYTGQNGTGDIIYHSDGAVNYCCDFINAQTLHAYYVPAKHAVTWNYVYIDPVDGTTKTLTNGDRSTTATVNIRMSDGTSKQVAVNAGTLSDGQQSAEATITLSVGTTESLTAPNVRLTEADMAKVVSYDVTITSGDEAKGYKVTKKSATESEVFYAQGAYNLPWVITPQNTIPQASWPVAIYVKVLVGTSAANATNPITEHASQSVRCELQDGKYVGSYPVREDIVGTNSKAYYRIQIVSVDNNGKESHFETYEPKLISAESDAKYYINESTDYTINYSVTIPVMTLDANGGELTTTTPQYAWESSISTSDNYAAVREGCDFLGWSKTQYTESKTPSSDYTQEYPISGGDGVLYAVWQDVQAPQVVFGEYNETAKEQAFTITDNMSGVQSLEYYLSTTAVEPSSISSWTSQSTTQPVQIPDEYKEQPKAYLYMKATDVAGNVMYYSKEIDVDPKAPTIVVVDKTRDDKVITDKIEGTNILVVCQRKDASQEIIPLTCTATIEDNVELKSVTVTMNGTDITSELTTVDIRTKTLLNMVPPTISGTDADANLYIITATDYIGNVTTQEIKVYNGHVWANEWKDIEPTATTPGRLSHKECGNCHVIILLESSRDEIDTTDPAQAAKATIPQGSVLVRGIVDHTDTPPTRGILSFDPFINTAIQLACGITDSEEIKLTAPSRLDGADAATDFKFLYMDKDDSDKDVKVENNITKSLLLNLNGQSIQKANGDAYTITGNSNVTILLTDNGELPYSNKSTVNTTPIKYAREVSSVQAGKWQALYIPFVPNDASATMNTSYGIGISIIKENGEYFVQFTNGGTPSAYGFCLIKSGEEGDAAGINNITAISTTLSPAKVDSPSSVGEGYTIAGSLRNDDQNGPFWVVNNGGKFAHAPAGNTQRPYRWVIYEPTGTAAKALSFRMVEPDVTGIKNVNANASSTAVYSIDGRKMPKAENLKPGIYIVGGKKIVVR